MAPVPANLAVACWNQSFPYGANYQCTVNVSSNAGSALGSINWSLDGAAPTIASLSGGNAQFTVPLPVVGTHKVVIDYPQQTNYGAGAPRTFTFSVTPAPVIVALTPSSWYAKVGTSFTFKTAIASWSAGAPNATGNVQFHDGQKLLATVPVNASGIAQFTTSNLSAASHTISAVYSGGTNYDTGSGTVVHRGRVVMWHRHSCLCGT